MVPRAAARTPPSTRAGGQDDGSYTNSLKLCVCDFGIHVGVHLGVFSLSSFSLLLLLLLFAEHLFDKFL